MIADKPWFESIAMRCLTCHTDYTGWLLCGCRFVQAAAYMQAMTCPACGADSGRLVVRTRAAGDA